MLRQRSPRPAGHVPARHPPPHPRWPFLCPGPLARRGHCTWVRDSFGADECRTQDGHKTGARRISRQQKNTVTVSCMVSRKPSVLLYCVSKTIRTASPLRSPAAALQDAKQRCRVRGSGQDSRGSKVALAKWCHRRPRVSASLGISGRSWGVLQGELGTASRDFSENALLILRLPPLRCLHGLRKNT